MRKRAAPHSALPAAAAPLDSARAPSAHGGRGGAGGGGRWQRMRRTPAGDFARLAAEAIATDGL